MGNFASIIVENLYVKGSYQTKSSFAPFSKHDFSNLSMQRGLIVEYLDVEIK